MKYKIRKIVAQKDEGIHLSTSKKLFLCVILKQCPKSVLPNTAATSCK